MLRYALAILALWGVAVAVIAPQVASGVQAILQHIPGFGG